MIGIDTTKMESFVLFCILCLTGISVQAANLTVSVYYESLCPDSVRFLRDQFYPPYTTVLKDKINVDLIPFGKATAKKENGTWTFDCQHGEKECYGNKVHGCVVDIAPKNNSTEFIICAMKSGDASNNFNLQQCANDYNITWSKIEECVKSGRGDELLAKNGERTDSVKPKITFIPTVLFNDYYSDKLQNLALKSFRETVEFLLENQDCLNSANSTIQFSFIVLLLSLISVFKLL